MPGTKEPRPAVLLDLSRSGMFVKGVNNVQLGAKVVVRFQLRPTGWCEADGTIVRRTEVVRLHGFGVHFDQVNDAFAAFMEKLETMSDRDRSNHMADVLAPVIEVATV